MTFILFLVKLFQILGSFYPIPKLTQSSIRWEADKKDFNIQMMVLVKKVGFFFLAYLVIA